jgi:DNA mismatch repair protein MutH
MSLLVQHIISEDGDQGLDIALKPILDDLSRRASQMSVLFLNHGLLRAAQILAKCGASCAALLLKYSIPRDKRRGRAWSETLLGHFLSPSCLPGSSPDSDTIFNDVVSQVKLPLKV